MSQPLKSIGIVRVFVASPGDVIRERESLAGIVNELNRTLSALLPGINIRLELVRWETNAFPAMGRPQGVINEQIGEYDIFIGILWKRFGTPTGQAQSGTEEEFRFAYDNWKKDGKPHILIYFNREPIPTPRNLDEVGQLSKVVSFRDEVSKMGLIWEYDSAERFADVVRPHLTEVVGSVIRGDDIRPSKGQDIVGELQTPSAPSGEAGGLRVRITDVGDKDALYKNRDDLVGRIGVLVWVRPRGDWNMGTVLLDKPRYEGDDREYPFIQFRYEPV